MRRALLRDWRVPLIFSLIAASGIFYSGHATSRVYPWMLVIFFLGMALIATLAVNGGSVGSIIGGALLIAISFRFHTNFITTPVGASPQGQPGRMEAIIETGVIATGSPFYDDAPLHFLLGATYSGIADISGYDAILLYSLLISVILCLIAIGLLRLVGITDPRALTAVAILALVTTEGLRRSYWVIPQVTGTIMLWVTFLALVKYITNPSRGLYLVLVVLAGALAVTHKLPLVFLAIILVGLLLLLLLDIVTWDNVSGYTPVYQVGSLLVFVSVVAGVQVVYVGLLGTIVRRIQRTLMAFFVSGASSVRGGEREPTGAVEALPGIIANYYQYPPQYSLFIERGHGVWLLLAAGIAWAYLFLFYRQRNNRPRMQTLLAISAIGVSLLSIGVIAIRGMNPTRPLFMIEPVLAVIIIATIWSGKDHISMPFNILAKRTAISMLLILLVASQIFAASAAPDYANTPRYYADVPEAQAEATFCEYTTSEVYVDAHYSRFVDINKESCEYVRTLGRDQNNDLFEGNMTSDKYQMFAFRNNVDVYLGDHDRWRLTWDPKNELSPEYHVVYNNEAVSIYHSGQ